MKVAAFQLQPSGLDLGQVKNVVDDGQQVLSGAVDLVEPDALFRCDAGAAQQMTQADDGVHGRADFVAHVGQEGALGPVGGVGLLARQGQFRRAARHQFFQMVPMVIEFITETLLLGDVFLDRHIVADRAIALAQRRDDGELDVVAAVLAAVVERALPRMALVHRGPQGREGLS